MRCGVEGIDEIANSVNQYSGLFLHFFFNSKAYVRLHNYWRIALDIQVNAITHACLWTMAWSANWTKHCSAVSSESKLNLFLSSTDSKTD